VDVSEFNKLGFITGVDRSELGDFRKTHLYRAEKDKDGNYLIMSPIEPLCQWGWNRFDGLYTWDRKKHKGNGYSIFRNNISKRGICKICERKVLEEIKERRRIR